MSDYNSQDPYGYYPPGAYQDEENQDYISYPMGPDYAGQTYSGENTASYAGTGSHIPPVAPPDWTMPYDYNPMMPAQTAAQHGQYDEYDENQYYNALTPAAAPTLTSTTNYPMDTSDHFGQPYDPPYQAYGADQTQATPVQPQQALSYDFPMTNYASDTGTGYYTSTTAYDAPQTLAAPVDPQAQAKSLRGAPPLDFSGNQRQSKHQSSARKKPSTAEPIWYLEQEVKRVGDPNDINSLISVERNKITCSLPTCKNASSFSKPVTRTQMKALADMFYAHSSECEATLTGVPIGVPRNSIARRCEYPDGNTRISHVACGRQNFKDRADRCGEHAKK